MKSDKGIKTYGVSHCVCVAIYSEKDDLFTLGHFYSYESSDRKVAEFLADIDKLYKHKDGSIVMLFGGTEKTYEDELSREKIDSKRRSDMLKNGLAKSGFSICLDDSVVDNRNLDITACPNFQIEIEGNYNNYNGCERQWNSGQVRVSVNKNGVGRNLISLISNLVAPSVLVKYSGYFPEKGIPSRGIVLA